MKYGNAFQKSIGLIDMRITRATYIPVLRYKDAERTALRKLTSQTRQAIVPLIEFVPKDFFEEAAQGPLVKVAKGLRDSCGWRYPFIVDPGLLGHEVAAKCIRQIMVEAVRYNPEIAIVTGISRPDVYQAAVEDVLRTVNSDLVLRLSSFEFRQAAVGSMIDQTLAQLGATRHQAHLILDFGYIAGSGMNFAAWFRNIPGLEEWKSVTVIAGTFPKDLTAFEPNEEYSLERGEWSSWCDLIHSVETPVAFGDYTVQHPFFEEREGKGFNFSASIRYTTPSGYLVFRGEGVQNPDGPGYQQYLGQATLLCSRDEFLRKEFCWGDAYIHEKGNGATDTGGPKQWLAAAINHHLTLVATQIEDRVGVPTAQTTTNN
jgi:hypothetical protein